MSFLSFFLSIGFYVSQLLNYGPAAWQTGDWLIDFAGGIVRRGLSGEILFQLAEITGLNRIFVIFSVQALLHTFLVLGTWFLYRRTNMGVAATAALVSPMFLGFYLSDPQAAFKKEILFLTFLLGFLLPKFSRAFLRSWLFVAVFAFAYLVIAMSHEVTVMASPMLLGGLYLVLKEERETSLFWRRIVPAWFMVSLATLLMALVIKPTGEMYRAICDRAVQTTQSDDACQGAIDWLMKTPTETLGLVLDTYVGNPVLLLWFSIGLAIAALPFASAAVPREVKWATYVTCVTLIPAFAFALDWGRWAFLLIASLTLLCFRFSGFGSRLVEGKPESTRGALAISLFGLAWGIGSIPAMGFWHGGAVFLTHLAMELLR